MDCAVYVLPLVALHSFCLVVFFSYVRYRVGLLLRDICCVTLDHRECREFFILVFLVYRLCEIPRFN